CTQRPDGYVVTVEGCDGDGLPPTSRRFDAATRGTRFSAAGDGFTGVDLLGRRIRFTVATAAGDRISEPVGAGPCIASVRPGRDASAETLGVGLTGRSDRVTLGRIGRSEQLDRLLGTRSYDAVDARLRRGDRTASGGGDVLAGPVRFEVDRCVGS